MPRTDQNSLLAHAQLLEKRTKGRIDVYFVGDSITRRWGATDYPELLANWRPNFFGWNAANFGWGADRTQNILWRLQNGELDGVNPKVIVMLAGTNNVGAKPGGPREGRRHHARASRRSSPRAARRRPSATIILTAIFPRNDNMAVMPEIDADQRRTSRGSPTADACAISTSTTSWPTRTGTLFDGMMNERDKLHPTLKGYQVWADALEADPHRAARPAGRDRSGAAADRRSWSPSITLYLTDSSSDAVPGSGFWVPGWVPGSGFVPGSLFTGSGFQVPGS